jgi:hypothetical protein
VVRIESRSKEVKRYKGVIGSAASTAFLTERDAICATRTTRTGSSKAALNE